MSKRFGIFLIYIFIISIFGGVKSFAQSQFSPTLTKMENALFGIDYSSQADEARLKRIEQLVYGQPSSSAVAQRVGKLSKDLSVDVMGQEIRPKSDTFAEDEASNKADIPKSDASVAYPAVDNLEREAFNKEYKDLDINQRLTNLEQRVFKKTYNDDLNSRVDRLKTALVPEQVAENNDDGENSNTNSNIYEPQDILSQSSSEDDYLASKNNTVPRYNSKNSVLDKYPPESDIQVPLSAIEKKMLKHSYPNDAIPSRLSRLEVQMFNSSFSDDDDETRMDRIASAYQAQKSSKKYDNNKASQHMSTAMQVGAVLLMILAAIL